MAESNQRKVADPIDLHDEDPFAELTRIMGFDPRVSARAEVKEPAAPVARPQPTAVVTPLIPKAAASARPVAHDDFTLDLEKELLGEFADFDEPAQAASPPPAQPPVVPQLAVIAPRPLEAPATAAPVFTAPVVASTAAPHAAVEDDAIQAAFDEQFDDAFADMMDDIPRHAAALQPAGPKVSEMPVAPAATRADVEPAAHIGTEPEITFDLGDLDFADHHDEPAVALQAPVAAPAMVEAAATVAADVAPPVAGTRHDDLSGDDLMADVDMDFSAAFDREFNAAADDRAMAETPALHVEPALPAIAADLPDAGQADDLVDFSLEDELGALLEAHDDLAPAAAAAPAPVAVDARPAQPVTDSRWAALEADEEDEPVQNGFQPTRSAAGDWSSGRTADTRRSFSDSSLTARHANFQTARAPEPEPIADLDDLIAAMDDEVHAGEPRAAKPAAEVARTAQPAAYVPFTSGFAPVAPQREEPAAYAQAPAAYAYDDLEGEPSYEAAPEIETIDVAETAVPVAHDLDIPELAYEEDEQQFAAAYDDIDADFSAAFNDKSFKEEPVNQAVRQVAAPAAHADFDSDFEALYRSSLPSSRDSGFAQPAAYQAKQSDYAPQADYDDEPSARDYDDFDDAGQAGAGGRDRFLDLDFENEADDEQLPAYSAYPAERSAAQAPRRGLMIAAIVGGVALLGGVGALALSYSGSKATSGTPVVVKADDSPVKVKPENPGGTVVPNQDSKVYDAVKGTDAATSAPAQEKLVTTSEEPVDMAAVDENGDLPGLNMEDDIVPKAEDRVAPTAETDAGVAPAGGIAVTPRKVKTMVVRSDGTLVPREDPAPAADPAATAAPAQPVAKTESTGTVASAETGEATTTTDAVPVKPVKTKPVATQAETAAPEASALPPANTVDQAPAAPKAEDGTQVAAVEPTAIAAGAWSVQIASQPSAEAAKSSYQDLAKRYSGVIGGRGVNIVKAEIAGKGTYWRVRVPAKSRDDAVQLCTDYKSAGGNCFVSK